VRTRAIVADVGNDILYGFSADRTLAWVDEAVTRLRRSSDDVIVVDLPMENVRQISAARFLFFRSLFFPGRFLSLEHVRSTAATVSAGLAGIAAAHDARLVTPSRDWYGLDPIHLRPAAWTQAWAEILCCGPLAAAPVGSPLEAARLYLAPPQRRWLFGIEQRSPQRGRRLPGGARVWLY
jgi:hypothetical protein